ncbi:MAG: FAD-dependent oxidoreductase [Candidatus Acidiferrum sp.]|jgi:glycine/D-amino acid oxidase-like deaminating enzyme
MSFRPDIVIVGAGIVGAACGFELAREKFSVAVVDAAGIGMQTTAAGMGHLLVLDDSEEQFALTRYSLSLWNALAKHLPPAVEYSRCGTLWVAGDEDEMAEVVRKHTYYGERGIQTEILDAHALREAEPALRRPLAGGLRVPGDAVLYPPCAAAYLLQRAAELGAKIFLGKAVNSIRNGITRLADGTVFHSKFIINAAGQFAPKLTPGIHIRPRKGHLVITDRYPGTITHQLMELGYLKSAHSISADSVAFNLQPRKTGQLLIGSARQYEVADGNVDFAILSRMLKRAMEYVPSLGSLSAIRVWTGFRPATPDQLPFIGPWPDDPSIFLAAGHEGLGITTSLATGRLAVDFLLRRASAIPVEPYLPSRQIEGVTHA